MTEWSWNAVPDNMTPEDAFKHCVENDIHHIGRGRIRCECVTYGHDGVGYGRPEYLTLEDIKARGGILHWFSGWSVCWTDQVIYPWPVGKRPFSEATDEVKDCLFRKFVWHRQFTGTRAEVRAFTSPRKETQHG